MLNTVQIGYTKKAFGVKGELKLAIEEAFVLSVENASVLFLEISGKQVPYFVEWLRSEYDLFVKFEEVDSKEMASKLSSKKIFLRKEDLLEDPDIVPHLFYQQYEGYVIHDETHGAIGAILRVEEFPQQEMALVDYKGKEIMIPLNDQLIERIDEQLRQDRPDFL